MINSIVDKIFVITTLNSQRVDYIKNHLNQNNIKFDFFVAPYAEIINDEIIVNDGGDISDKNHKALISLISAYVSIIEIAKISNFKSICVIEDDCYFQKEWVKKLQDFFNYLPNNWDLLNLGYHPLHDTDTIKEKYNDYVNIPLNWHHTTHCMIIKNTCYEKFLQNVRKFQYTIPADYIFNEIYKEQKLKCFYPIEVICYQLSVRKNVYNIPDLGLRFESLLIN